MPGSGTSVTLTSSRNSLSCPSFTRFRLNLSRPIPVVAPVTNCAVWNVPVRRRLSEYTRCVPEDEPAARGQLVHLRIHNAGIVASYPPGPFRLVIERQVVGAVRQQWDVGLAQSDGVAVGGGRRAGHGHGAVAAGMRPLRR